MVKLAEVERSISQISQIFGLALSMERSDMDLEKARALAEQYIEENLRPTANGKYLIVDAGIQEVSEGWYFPYQTAKFIETRDIEYSVLGNWPIFVSKGGVCMGPQRPCPVQTSKPPDASA